MPKKTKKAELKNPCIICGEPVIAESMSGTEICPWCDMGKCRYCSMPIFVLREKMDNGKSKRELLTHMKWHKEAKSETLAQVLKMIDERIKKNKRELAEFERVLQEKNLEDRDILKRDNELFKLMGEDISEGSLAQLEIDIFKSVKSKIKTLKGEK